MNSISIEVSFYRFDFEQIFKNLTSIVLVRKRSSTALYRKKPYLNLGLPGQVAWVTPVEEENRGDTSEVDAAARADTNCQGFSR